MPARRISQMRVLVTGASSGIGRQLALQLAASGAKVLATARRESHLIALLREHEQQTHCSAGSIDILAGDLTLAAHRHRLFQWIDSNWQAIDVLVNNAGSGAIGRFAEASPDRMRRVMEIDFFAPVELTRQIVPLLRRGHRPAIVLIGSVLALRAVPLKSEYCAAKFALRGWAEALRCELATEKIEVLQIHPSTTRSEFFDSLLDTDANQKSVSFGSVDPAKVAKAVISGLVRSRREMILSPGGKALVWAAQRFPRLVDRLVSWSALPK